MSRCGFRLAVRVYYEDTDAAGIVYHASYLRFMERARTEWLRSRGFDQSRLAGAHEVLFVVSRLAIRYLHPAYLDDCLHVHLQPGRIGRAGLQLHQRVTLAEGRMLCDGDVRVACVHPVHRKPQAIPPNLLSELRSED